LSTAVPKHVELRGGENVRKGGVRERLTVGEQAR
jgi:hypothetical protein